MLLLDKIIGSIEIVAQSIGIQCSFKGEYTMQTISRRCYLVSRSGVQLDRDVRIADSGLGVSGGVFQSPARRSNDGCRFGGFVPGG